MFIVIRKNDESYLPTLVIKYTCLLGQLFPLNLGGDDLWRPVFFVQGITCVYSTKEPHPLERQKNNGKENPTWGMLSEMKYEIPFFLFRGIWANRVKISNIHENESLELDQID